MVATLSKMNITERKYTKKFLREERRRWRRIVCLRVLRTYLYSLLEVGHVQLYMPNQIFIRSYLAVFVAEDRQ
jgi:hypothetical protein